MTANGDIIRRALIGRHVGRAVAETGDLHPHCPACDGMVAVARFEAVVEALWDYREYIGHVFTNGNPDAGCITGCPGCRADAALRDLDSGTRE